MTGRWAVCGRVREAWEGVRGVGGGAEKEREESEGDRVFIIVSLPHTASPRHASSTPAPALHPPHTHAPALAAPQAASPGPAGERERESTQGNKEKRAHRPVTRMGTRE